MRVIDAVRETIADVSSAGLRLIRSDEGPALETSPIVSFRASITLSNTQLTLHHFVFRRADAVTYSSLKSWHYYQQWVEILELVTSSSIQSKFADSAAGPGSCFSKPDLANRGFVTETLHLNFLSSNQHELIRRKARTVHPVINIGIQAFW